MSFRARSLQRALCVPAAAGVVVGLLLIGRARAGGTIGWAEAVNQFSQEGVAVGAAAVVLGILAVGAILMFGITGLITTVALVCLGGALMGKAQEIGTALFNGGAGGGSILATTYAARHAPLTEPPVGIR
jgi:hypothetical protein